MNIDLIITADDLGYSENRNTGIFKSIQTGVVQRTSLLVNSTKAVEAALASKNKNIKTGVVYFKYWYTS